MRIPKSGSTSWVHVAYFGWFWVHYRSISKIEQHFVGHLAHIGWFEEEYWWWRCENDKRTILFTLLLVLFISILFACMLDCHHLSNQGCFDDGCSMRPSQSLFSLFSSCPSSWRPSWLPFCSLTCHRTLHIIRHQLPTSQARLWVIIDKNRNLNKAYARPRLATLDTYFVLTTCE